MTGETIMSSISREEREEWRPVTIPGFETRYAVSSLGRVKSLHFGRERILAPSIGSRGYRLVGLNSHLSRSTQKVHRLVALAFHGEQQTAERCCVAHLDGDPLNNRADNLQWVSHSENEAHKSAHGTRRRGERHASSKLTDEQVRRIRTRYASPREIAEEHGITRSYVYQLQAGWWRAK